MLQTDIKSIYVYKMEQNPPEEERFITNVLDLTALVHELATICWDAGRKEVNPQLVAFAETYLESYNSVDLIETFIRHSNKHWEKIRTHDEQFYIENAHTIFQHLPIKTDNVNAFKLFFTAKDDNGEDIIIEDDRNAIWDIFESLVKISIKYIHRIRGVKLVSTKEGLRPAYIGKQFREIKVRELAKLWRIELPVPGQQ